MRIVLIIALLCCLSLSVLAQVTDTSDPLQGGFRHSGPIWSVKPEKGITSIFSIFDNQHDIKVYDSNMRLVYIIPAQWMQARMNIRPVDIYLHPEGDPYILISPLPGTYAIESGNQTRLYVSDGAKLRVMFR